MNNLKNPIMKRKIGQYTWIIFRAVLLIGICFMILYPLSVKFCTAVKSYDDMRDPTVFYLAKHPTLGNFKTVISSVSYFKRLLISFGFVGAISVLQLVSCTVTAYGFARFNFPLKRLFFALVMFTLVIPPQAVLLPLYIKFRYFNVLELFKFTGVLSGISLIDTAWPFILLSATATAFKNGLFIFMLRQHFRAVPQSLEEAAYIDGCGVFKTFYRIIIPGARSMLITVFLFSFVWQWNDYYYTQMLAPQLPTLNVALAGTMISGLDSVTSSMYESMLQAPKFLLLISPLIIIYLFTQRYFVESIEKSGIVG